MNNLFSPYEHPLTIKSYNKKYILSKKEKSVYIGESSRQFHNIMAKKTFNSQIKFYFNT